MNARPSFNSAFVSCRTSDVVIPGRIETHLSAVRPGGDESQRGNRDDSGCDSVCAADVHGRNADDRSQESTEDPELRQIRDAA